MRAATTIAKTKGDISVACVDGQYWPSWKKAGKHAHRVLRAGQNGAEVNPDKVIWRTGPYVKNEVVHSYEVVDRISNDKVVKYILVIKGTSSEAKRIAKERHKNYVLRHRGLAKLALGLAMHKVSARESAAAGNVSESAKSIGAKNVKAWQTSSGFSSGQFNLHVEDNLDYAGHAVKGGESCIQDYVRKALNGMVGFLAKKLDRSGIEDTMKIPYSELKQ